MPPLQHAFIWKILLDIRFQTAIMSRWDTCRPRICMSSWWCQLGQICRGQLQNSPSWYQHDGLQTVDLSLSQQTAQHAR